MVHEKEILALRIIHITGALILYFSMLVLIYSGIYEEVNSLVYLSLIFLVLELLFVIIMKDCPLMRVHKRFGDKKGFFGLFLPVRYTKTAFTYSVIMGLFSFVFYVARII